MQSLIYYISYASFPFLIGLIWILVKHKKSLSKLWRAIIIFLLILSISFIYARFIERNFITINNHKIEVGFSTKIIVIADMHLGIYKNEHFMKRVVERMKTIQDVDAILIPGDFTYYPTQSQKLETLFASFAEIDIPIFAVLGNHDSERPGPPLQKELRAALEKHGVTFLHNTHGKFKDITVLGLGDNWAKEDDISLIENFDHSENLIVITHNPDTTLNYHNNIPDLTISGHTHGGQIRIPFIYKHAIPCRGDFDKGLYENEFGKLFITTGLGEVGLPMRLGIPPAIEVIELY